MFKISTQKAVNRSLFEVKDGMVRVEETCPLIEIPPYCHLKSITTLKYDVETDSFILIRRANRDNDLKLRVRCNEIMKLPIRLLVEGKHKVALNGVLKEAFCTFVYEAGCWKELIPDAPKSCYTNYPNLIHRVLFGNTERNDSFLANTLLLAFDAWTSDVTCIVENAKSDEGKTIAQLAADEDEP